NVGVGSVEQSMSFGLRMTSPFVVSYHWYRKPSKRFRWLTSFNVAAMSDRACGLLTRPRSLAATTAHRYTPMLAAEVYVPFAGAPPKPMLSIGRWVFESTSAL